jgi:hypothetical protein
VFVPEIAYLLPSSRAGDAREMLVRVFAHIAYPANRYSGRLSAKLQMAIK